MKSLIMIVVLLFESHISNAQWMENTPITGSVFNIVEKDNKLFASNFGGMFQSQNKGFSWTKVKSLSEPKYNGVEHYINNIVVGKNVMYQGIYKSLDEGLNWIPMKLPKYVSLMLCYYDFELIVGDFVINNIYVSQNTGTSWRNITLNLPFVVNAQEIEFKINAGKYFCINDSTLYESKDKGATWSKSTLTANLWHLYPFGNDLYAVSNRRIYISGDNGTTWKSKFFPDDPISFTVLGSDLIVPTLNGIYKSTNVGDNWSKLPEDKSILWSNGKQILASSSGILYAPSAFGVSYSKDGGISWKASDNTGFKKQGCTQIKFVRSRMIASYSYSQDYGSCGKTCISVDSGVTWKTIYPFRTARSTANLGNKVVAVDGLNIYSSVDSAATWKRSDSGITNYKCYDLAYDGKLLYAASGDLYFSNDSATSWSKVLGIGLPANPFIFDISTDTNNLFAIVNRFDLYASSDQGMQWKKLNLGNSEEITSIHCFGDKLIATTYSEIYLSTDAGGSWKSIKNNLAYNAGDIMLYYKSKLIICGRGCPVHISDTTFTTWHEIESTGLEGYVKNWDMAIVGDYLYLADGLSGLYKRKLSEILAVSNKEVEVGGTAILFPNPVGDLLQIDLTEPFEYSIADASGKLVSARRTGNNPILVAQLDGGIYFMTLYTAKGKMTQKLVKQ